MILWHDIFLTVHQTDAVQPGSIVLNTLLMHYFTVIFFFFTDQFVI